MKYDLYDFDGTIYDGDSGVDFILFSIKKKKLKWSKVISSSLKFIFKLCSKEEFKTNIFGFVKDIDDIDKYVDEFWLEHKHKIKDFWKEKKKHNNDIIISASCEFWLKPIADEYKVKDLIATKLDVKTGKIRDNNCHGKEKVKLFYDKYPKAIVNKMYTDSVNDLPLIEEAKEGILVKKNKLIPYYEYKPNAIVRFWRWGWGIYHKNEELWNYLIVGCLTTLVSLVTKWSLLFTVFSADNALQLQLAIIISWIIAVLFAYVTNRIYVFKSKNKNILKEMASFFSARIMTLLMEMFIMWFFVTLLKLNSDLLVVIWTFITQVLVMVGNYILSKIFVFKKRK